MLSFIDDEEADETPQASELQFPQLPQQQEPQQQQRRRLLAPRSNSSNDNNGSSSSSSNSDGSFPVPVFRPRMRRQGQQQEQEQAIGPSVKPSLTHKEFLARRAAEFAAAATESAASKSAAADGAAGAAGIGEVSGGPPKRQRRTGWSEAEAEKLQEGQSSSGWGPPVDPKVQEERRKAIELALEGEKRRVATSVPTTEEEEAERALQRMW